MDVSRDQEEGLADVEVEEKVVVVVLTFARRCRRRGESGEGIEGRNWCCKGGELNVANMLL
jgi:hypothetical protein